MYFKGTFHYNISRAVLNNIFTTPLQNQKHPSLSYGIFRSRFFSNGPLLHIHYKSPGQFKDKGNNTTDALTMLTSYDRCAIVKLIHSSSLLTGWLAGWMDSWLIENCHTSELTGYTANFFSTTWLYCRVAVNVTLTSRCWKPFWTYQYSHLNNVTTPAPCYAGLTLQRHCMGNTVAV